MVGVDSRVGWTGDDEHVQLQREDERGLEDVAGVVRPQGCQRVVYRPRR